MAIFVGIGAINEQRANRREIYEMPPRDGFTVTLFITVADIDRSARPVHYAWFTMLRDYPRQVGHFWGSRQGNAFISEHASCSSCKTDSKGSVHKAIDENYTRKLTNLIEPAVIEDCDSCPVANPLQGRLSGGIESQRETQTAAFTEPEKHWAPGPCGAAYARVDRLSDRHGLESK